MSPEKLRQLADDLDKKAEEAFRAGNAAEGILMSEAADEARYLAERKEKELEGRRKGSQSGTLKPMLPAARVRISKGVSRGKEPTELQVVASFANHTLRSLAQELGCSNVFLSKALHGEKAIRESWAKRIQGLTRSKEHPHGFAATRRNWPAGWAREPGE